MCFLYLHSTVFWLEWTATVGLQRTFTTVCLNAEVGIQSFPWRGTWYRCRVQLCILRQKDESSLSYQSQVCTPVSSQLADTLPPDVLVCMMLEMSGRYLMRASCTSRQPCMHVLSSRPIAGTS